MMTRPSGRSGTAEGLPPCLISQNPAQIIFELPDEREIDALAITRIPPSDLMLPYTGLTKSTMGLTPFDQSSA